MTFLDTNVCLDLISGRSPWHKDAEKLVSIHIVQSLKIGISVISIPTLAYLLERHHTSVSVNQSLEHILTFMELLDVNKEMTLSAIHGEWSDIEDAIQHECAIYYGAGCIITRNKKVFSRAQIPVFTPGEWIQEFNF